MFHCYELQFGMLRAFLQVLGRRIKRNCRETLANATPIASLWMPELTKGDDDLMDWIQASHVRVDVLIYVTRNHVTLVCSMVSFITATVPQSLHKSSMKSLTDQEAASRGARERNDHRHRDRIGTTTSSPSWYKFCSHSEERERGISYMA